MSVDPVPSRPDVPTADQDREATLAQVEAALRISEERLALAMEATTDGLYDWSTPDGPIYLSPRFYTMLGFDPGEFPATREAYISLLHPEDRDRIVAILSDYTGTTREAHFFECRMRTKEGSYRWILSRGRVVTRHPDGRTCRIVGTQVDVTALRTSTTALRESETRYRLVVNAMHEGVVIQTATGSIEACNRKAAEILGISEDQLLDRNSNDPRWNAIHEDGHPFVAEEHPSMVCLRTGNPVIGATMGIRRPTGELVWLRISAEPMIDPSSGAVRASVVTFSDFTERKKVEDELRIKEQAMATAISALAIADGQGRIIYGNPSFRRMWGYESESELIGRKATRFWQSPSDAFSVFQSLRTTGGWVGEVTARRRDGSTFEALLAASVVHDAEGLPQFMLASVLDITTSKQQEMALRSADERLRKVIANTPVILFALDKDGTFTLSEGKGLEALGLQPGEVVGRSVFDVYRDFPRIANAVRRSLRGELLTTEVQIGETCFEVHWEPMKDTAGTVTGLIGVAMDVTVRKNAEKERSSLLEQLVQAQKMESVGRLAGGVAHDFNNLLTVINGYSELVLSKLPQGDAMRAAIAEIRKAGERAAQLTGQLLTLSRKQTAVMKAINVNALILESLEILRKLAGESVEVIIQLRRDLNEVHADAGQLHQVLMNLVANARDAMPRGGQFIIETSNFEVNEGNAAQHPELRPGSYVMIQFSDTGVGMTAEIKRRVFEPFFTTKGVGRGTGLGLSTVYGIMHQSGGHIWVESEPGCGSTFKLVLPRSTSPTADEAVDQNTVPDSCPGTILVVEDQDEVRDLTVKVLRDHGYSVLEARTGWEALALAGRPEQTIDLLLTDCVMPGLSGPELAVEVCRLSPMTKVIYMTGYAEEPAGRKVLPPDGVDLLMKPFTPSSLVRRVRSALGGRPKDGLGSGKITPSEPSPSL